MIILIFLLGSNVSKSLTPQVYYYIFKNTKLKFLYRGLSVFSKCFYSIYIYSLLFSSLLNVTIPLKLTVFFTCNFISKSSYFSRSLNLLFNIRSSLFAFNTDGYGFYFDFFSRLSIRKPISVLILGAGGAFRNIINNVSKISNVSIFYLYNRSFSHYCKDTLVNLNYVFYSFLLSVDIIINTIPLNSFLNFLFLNPILVSKTVFVYDITYGLDNILSLFFCYYFFGFGMLYRQALENFKVFIIKNNIRKNVL